jgi:hypothetical protein
MKIKPESALLELTATSSYNTMQKATKAMCKHRSKEGNIGLIFSIFDTAYGGGSEDWVVKHPDIWSDEPVFTNRVSFFSDYWRISDAKVESNVMLSPTWSDVICEANRHLIDDSDGSTACLFLEGFRDCGLTSDGVRQIEFIWGS